MSEKTTPKAMQIIEALDNLPIEVAGFKRRPKCYFLRTIATVAGSVVYRSDEGHGFKVTIHESGLRLLGTERGAVRLSPERDGLENAVHALLSVHGMTFYQHLKGIGECPAED